MKRARLTRVSIWTGTQHVNIYLVFILGKLLVSTKKRSANDMSCAALRIIVMRVSESRACAVLVRALNEPSDHKQNGLQF
jgi:hypothetical protein